MTEPVTVTDDSCEADLIGMFGETSVEAASARLEGVLRAAAGGTVYLATRTDVVAGLAFRYGAAEVIWLGPLYARYLGLHDALGVNAMARHLDADELERARTRWHAVRGSEIGVTLRREDHEAVNDGDPQLLRMSEVVPQEIDWLWKNRFPTGRLTTVSGVPGMGKSYFTIDMASRVSTGRPWPDGASCRIGSVVLVTCEDDPADTIRPRLDACGADTARVHVLTGVHRIEPKKQKRSVTAFTMADLQPLESALQRLGDVRLVVIDPIGSYFGTNADSNTDTEVRSLLAPLAALAQRFRVAIVLVAHTRKSAGITADETVMGSRAFTGLARAVHHVARDPGDRNRRLLLPGKCNIAVEQRGLGFRLIGMPVPSVTWDGQPVHLTADEAFAQKGPAGNRERPGAAVDWLRELLQPSALPAGEVKQAALAAGFVWRTVQDAAVAIGVVRRKADFAAGWLWLLPDPGGTENPGREPAVPSGSSASSASNRQSDPRHVAETDVPSTKSPNGRDPCEGASLSGPCLRGNRPTDAEVAQDPQGTATTLPGSAEDLDRDLLHDGGGW